MFCSISHVVVFSHLKIVDPAQAASLLARQEGEAAEEESDVNDHVTLLLRRQNIFLGLILFFFPPKQTIFRFKYYMLLDCLVILTSKRIFLLFKVVLIPNSCFR